MDGFGRVVVLAGLLAASVHAHALEGRFGVSVRVPPPPAVALGLLDAVPLPAGATRLTRTPAGDSYYVAAEPDAAAAT
jgi:hypothetical protein